MEENSAKINYSNISFSTSNGQKELNNLIERKKKKNERETIQVGDNIVKKERNPGIEILRIIAMYDIIIHHIIMFGQLLSKYENYKVLQFMNTLCYFHICVFGLISGIVGIKTHKYSNLFYLWFCVFLYSVSIHLIYKQYKPFLVQNHKTYEFFFPVVFNKYWYFTSYFGMYLFLPIINKGISYLNQLELKIIVLNIISIFIIWKDFLFIYGDPFKLASGYSVIGLLVFYITGAYMGKYNIIKKTRKLLHLIYLIIFICITYLCYYLSVYNGKKKNSIIIIKLKEIFNIRINSIAMVIQGVSLTLIFSRIEYNKFLSKIVRFLGPLTFGNYLIHSHEDFFIFEFRSIFLKYPMNTPLRTILFLIFIKGFEISVVCFIIDYLRNLVFKLLKIRKLCILLEKGIKYVLNETNYIF